MNDYYPPLDEIVALRLELHRVTDQRDAFQAALHKDVLALAKAAVFETANARSRDEFEAANALTVCKAEADRSKDQYNGIIDTQLGVIAALRAEVESLAALSRRMDETINAAQAECRRLKAEVEALMTTPTSRLLRASQAENISLRKAGDAMASNVVYIADVDIPMETLRQFSAGWNAAKEGIETA